MMIPQPPHPDPQLFASTVILATGTLGVFLFTTAPLCGLALFGLAAAAAYRIVKRS